VSYNRNENTNLYIHSEEDNYKIPYEDGKICFQVPISGQLRQNTGYDDNW